MNCQSLSPSFSTSDRAGDSPVTTQFAPTALRNHARTSLQLRLDGVVPFGQSFMAVQSKGSNLIRCGLETTRIETAVEISSDLKSGLGLGSTSIVEDLLVRIQRFAGPVARDFGEEAMLDGIPFWKRRWDSGQRSRPRQRS